MLRHVRALGVVSLVRSFLELALGGYLLVVALRWGATAWPCYHPSAVPQPGDREAFLAAGIVLVLLAVVRGWQAGASLAARDWARRAGLALAALDFVTPLTLPIAFWSLVVYRHPETRELFQNGAGRQADAAPAALLDRGER